jgi:Holliday junction resolvase RusA-like endonuclease
MEHWLPCIPPKVSHHAKRIVRVGKFARLADKAELTAARGDLIVMLQQIAPPMALDPTGSEPYRLELTYYWPYLTTDPKSFKVKRWLIPHITKPDCDNIAKTFIDCLVRTGFLQQDSRIWDLRIRKYRGPTPGIHFKLEVVNGVRPVPLGNPASHKARDRGVAEGPPDLPVGGVGAGPAGPLPEPPRGSHALHDLPADPEPAGNDASGERGEDRPEHPDPSDARHRRCDICTREQLTTVWDGVIRRCRECEQRNQTSGCPDCGHRGAVRGHASGHALCALCGADLTFRASLRFKVPR